MTTTSTNETEIVVDPDVPLVRITREFDAPPAKVFRAHTDPELFAQLARAPPPRDADRPLRLPHRRVVPLRARAATASEYGFHGCFHEVRPSELIVQTFTFEGVPDGVALERLVVRGPRRRPHPARPPPRSSTRFEDRDAFVASGMEDGVREGYERLDELLAG